MNNNLVINPNGEFQRLLPDSVKSRQGAVFNPNSDQWHIKDSAHEARLNFSTLRDITPQLLAGLKLALIWFAENRSSPHLENIYARFLHFWHATHASISSSEVGVSSVHILNYRSTLNSSTDWYLRPLSSLFRKWNSLGHFGVDQSVVSLLDDMKLGTNRQGDAVRTMSPITGPFTEIELDAIQASVNQVYASNKISTEDYILVWLFMLLGARPVQYALLKICDFRVIRTPDGGSEYCLKVPRAKQRHGKPRLEFKERVIAPYIGKLIVAYVEELRRRFAPLLADVSQAPLFPQMDNVDGMLPGYEYHQTSDQLAGRLRQRFESLSVQSERTGTYMRITANRFRRTVGTRAAQEGHGELIIAELLDHSDTSNVGVYVEATPAIVERIDKAIAMQLAPLAQAFAGVLVKDPSQAVRGNDPSSLIVGPHIDRSLKPMGNCGTFGFCGQLAPIACYTCTNFQPWLDGPHEKVLSYLIDEREKIAKSSDLRIASINDRTILAVAEVVRRCNAENHKEGDVFNV